MNVVCIKEIKRHEYRVGLTPDGVAAFAAHGHRVFVEAEAGLGSGFSDKAYEKAGAIVDGDKKALFAKADMIVKVKELLPEEYPLLKEDLVVFAYLHLAADPVQAKALLDARVKAVAFETIRDKDGSLPCLKPMSEIAGRLSVQEGAKYLEKPFNGRGVLLGGVPGVARGKVLVLGGGVVGLNAAKMAAGLGAEVTIVDVNAHRLAYLDDIFGGRIGTLYSSQAAVEKLLTEADLVIGSVLIPGSKAPHVVKKADLAGMKKGAVLVDVAVDQGGCFETTRATTHDEPVYQVEGVQHYCVANMPGAVSLTSTLALANTTLKYGLLLADEGLEAACRKSPELAQGLNLYKGVCVYPGVAEALGLELTPLDAVV